MTSNQQLHKSATHKAGNDPACPTCQKAVNAVTKDQRFGKTAVREYALALIETLEETYGFSTESGYAQVMGKGEEVNREYGAYSALQDLLDRFSL